MVRSYKGSHSGDHGDGLVRSEFHRARFGDRMVESFEWVKDRMDPVGLLNPNRLVRPPQMDDRSLFRYPPDYAVPELETAFHCSAYSGTGGGFQGAVAMCNNNAACPNATRAMSPPQHPPADQRNPPRRLGHPPTAGRP